jgi:uncharacterized protein Yka (UPF0111/DUF47 family)
MEIVTKVANRGDSTDPAEVEEELSRILLIIAEIQDKIWDDVESLQERGLLAIELEEFVREVMSDISYWMDQCTRAIESPPVLLRRMEIHLARIQKLQELVETVGEGEFR